MCIETQFKTHLVKYLLQDVVYSSSCSCCCSSTIVSRVICARPQRRCNERALLKALLRHKCDKQIFVI